MDNATFSWGWVIFIVLILWFFLGNNGRGFGYGPGYNSCGMVSNCQVERQGLITAAETNYRIIDEAQKTTDTISSQLRAQWDAAQGEKIFDLKINALAAQNEANLKLMQKDATIERMTLANSMNSRFNQIDSTLASINCRMLPKPELFGLASVQPTTSVVNGMGFNPVSVPYGCGCGYGYNAQFV